jgi:SAM-dependent methyltransferase
MIKTVEFNGKQYPQFQAEGNAAKYAIPFAKEVCIGEGYDIGCNRPEWAFPGAVLIDPAINQYDALNLPMGIEVDYIFSSHCLEHIPDWVRVLKYWLTKIKSGGTLFLYLPHYDQEYWRPWNNRKHVNVLTAEMITDFLKAEGCSNIFSSDRDLNHSFMVIAQKEI